jgi:hypothetical protein
MEVEFGEGKQGNMEQGWPFITKIGDIVYHSRALVGYGGGSLVSTEVA